MQWFKKLYCEKFANRVNSSIGNCDENNQKLTLNKPKKQNDLLTKNTAMQNFFIPIECVDLMESSTSSPSSMLSFESVDNRNALNVEQLKAINLTRSATTTQLKTLSTSIVRRNSFLCSTNHSNHSIHSTTTTNTSKRAEQYSVDKKSHKPHRHDNRTLSGNLNETKEFSTNLNVNGNGESSGTSAQSTETRRRKIIIVSESNNNWHQLRKSNLTSGENQSQSSGDINEISDGEQSLKCSPNGQKNLKRRTKRDENRISDNSLTDSNSDSDTDDESDKNVDAKSFNDWVLISLGLERVRLIDNVNLDEEQYNGNSSCLGSSTLQTYFATSEFRCYTNNTIITLHSWPSTNSLLNRDCQCDRFTSSQSIVDAKKRHGKVHFLLQFINFLRHKLKFGLSTPRDGHHKNMQIMRKHQIIESSQLISIESLYSICDDLPNGSFILDDPCSSYKTMKSFDLFSNAPSLYPLSESSEILNDSCDSSVINSSINCVSVQEQFGLNDGGDIIICIDHIEEHSGFSFLLRPKKHKNVAYAQEVRERKMGGFGMVVKRFFKEIVDAVRNGCRGE